MKPTRETIAERLLQINAIKLQPANPFTWASGWLSPIYCDNRKTLSYPEVRAYIRDSMTRLIKEKYNDVDVIAGVATGAIAIGALVADALNKPFIYIRSAPKDHGLENLVEGNLNPGQKVVIIEDLISTGGSSLKAVKAVREQGGNVQGMVAIFTYGFQVAADSFEKEGVELLTLCDYISIIEVAARTGYVSSSQLDVLDAWRKSPSTWKK